MTITIDLTSLSYHITGIERYAMCITEEMIKQDRKNNYILIFRNEIHPMFFKYIKQENIKTKILYGDNKLLFYQIILPLALYKIKSDRFLFFAFTSPILFFNKQIYNTIHDMGPWDAPEALRLLQKIYLKITCMWSARISKKIITVSNFSKQRISLILKYPDKNIEVIPSAIYKGITDYKSTNYSDVKEMYHLPDKYIMSLSTLEPRKNLELLLRAFTNVMNQVDYDLVLVGRKGWKMDDVLKKYNAQKRIIITGFVNDEHVAQIYKNAMCFVFPSIYEGFGLPPVEALALGTPVVASDAASLPEVLMDQAVYFANNSIIQLEAILLNLDINVKNMPNNLSDFQIAEFSFVESAKKVLKLIEK